MPDFAFCYGLTFVILYRYLSAENALKSLQTNRFRVSPLGMLNDIFDCAPLIVREKSQGQENPEKDFWFTDFVFAQLGVICFSEEWDNLLLWAHYGSGYSGIALGFESEELADTHRKPFLRKIDYSSNDRPIVVEDEIYKLPDTGGARRDYLIDRYSKKGRNWEYEKETRLFVPFLDCKPIGTDFFCEFPPTSLKKVILGPKCNLGRTIVERSLEFRSDGGFYEAQVLKAVPKEATFGLEEEHVWL
ncbi:hypothetical protein TSACC_3675 [Terrimicrobium sacchariphilum]|uniref:DUF2971 domain-containing protein n=2 Tax=Terrimicrobium sacchariphilum TaxID=690879 RepID=A0A146GG46_TERSA|nr:hypothetical protein TSACC_3675 [Terrimicrobium sacchariphilum]